MTWIC